MLAVQFQYTMSECVRVFLFAAQKSQAVSPAFPMMEAVSCKGR